MRRFNPGDRVVIKTGDNRLGRVHVVYRDDKGWLYDVYGGNGRSFGVREEDMELRERSRHGAAREKQEAV